MSRIPRKVVGGFLAVLLAGIGTFTLLLYVRGAEDRALAGERVVDVYVVEEPVKRGTAAEDLGAQVVLTKVPAKVVPAGTVDRLDLLDGKVAAVDLVPGEQLLSSRFVTPEALRAQTEVEIPQGLHQVTISLQPQRALGGRISPGDKVGVLASFDPFEDATGADAKTPNSTHLILHKVLVTNVQMQGSRAGASPPTGGADDDGDRDNEPQAPPSGELLVTLAIDAPSVERVVFSAEHGRVWLSHEPDTAPEDGTEIQTRDTVYR